MMSWTELEARSVNNFSGLGGSWTSSSIRGDHSTPQGPGMLYGRSLCCKICVLSALASVCPEQRRRRTVCSSWRLQR